jgi:antitoxin VapB
MALRIKSGEADRLARELAAETGETLTEVVEVALRERLDREHARHAASMRTHLARLAAGVAALRGCRCPDAGGDHRLRRRWPAALTDITVVRPGTEP